VAKPIDAAVEADALIVLTEWKNYKSPNLRALKDALRSPLVLDGRNLYEPHAMAAAGLTCIGIGRNNLALLPAQDQLPELAQGEPAAAAAEAAAEASAVLSEAAAHAAQASHRKAARTEGNAA
jgi:hypothetical protein